MISRQVAHLCITEPHRNTHRSIAPTCLKKVWFKMSSADPGPLNSQVPKKLSAAERKTQRFQKQREQQEESNRLCGEYADLSKRIQGKPCFRAQESLNLPGQFTHALTSRLPSNLVGAFSGNTVDLTEDDGFLTVLQTLNGLHTRGMLAPSGP